jgi:16S rRNA (adenine1518-N6/adenine1519-N6)-dimethyltransferase
MIDPSIFQKLNDYASLKETDVVLEVEKDRTLEKILKEQLNDLTNIQIVLGDILNVQIPPFNKAVSIPPYQISSKLLLWLFERQYECGVFIFQKEFANRLVAEVGTEDYSWLTVLTRYYARVELLDSVPKYSFFPQPKVDSTVVRLTKEDPNGPLPKVRNPAQFKQILRILFSNRNKKVANAIAPFIRSTTLKWSSEELRNITSTLPFKDRRVRTLSPEDFGEVVNTIVN